MLQRAMMKVPEEVLAEGLVAEVAAAPAEEVVADLAGEPQQSQQEHLGATSTTSRTYNATIQIPLSRGWKRAVKIAVPQGRTQLGNQCALKISFTFGTRF
jgi:hypothetical protein